MKILITNDDGINAPGLMALKEALDDFGETVVVAPAFEQSGVSHAFSISNPLRLKQVTLDDGATGYSVTGTPVDTVKLALRHLLDEPPGLVVSGINPGDNSGVNVLYSGTVAAAMEGTVLGIPSVAVSLCSRDYKDYSLSISFTRKLCGELLKNGLPSPAMLNVNIPPLPETEIKGVRITHQAESHYIERIEKRLDPFRREYYWIGGKNKYCGDGEGSDMQAVKEGYISITPLKATQTHNEVLPVLKGWKLDR